ncbi:hypothetical protein SAMN04515665_11556 [Blastococcus sp. DSM 46786]|uniref:hypothetical protein n=1 Tax=Blastococcus sp. DSM 46786 TaxID=1798227 RepID=UPI0008BB45AF|nr:hypothetical protein [Blastococcus sp. DSM 46786]SEL60067.1 hypothetical protein SAMN04515665_11556 [Blastococcus sp. DSM 46786]
MSMSSPFEPHLRDQDESIPAADPGAGAPPTADGFGIGGEEPDRAPETDRPGPGTEDVDPPEDPTFRTPDPHDVGPASEN